MPSHPSSPYPAPVEPRAPNPSLADAGNAPESLAPESLAPARWRTNLILFVATVFAVFLAGVGHAQKYPEEGTFLNVLRALPHGWTFAVPLLLILLFHEFGHYFAARIHKVAASLPYFIPFLNMLGTMGAVISMPQRIKSRNALLDIGASGPLAGLVIAIPVLIIGLLQSPVLPISGQGIMEGQNLLYIALKRIVLGPIPEGHDVFLSPVALAGWAGLFLTMLNLVPVGQLDGGHIAYALFGRRQDRYSRFIHFALLGIFLFNLARFMIPAVISKDMDRIITAFWNSTFWLFWFGILHVIKRLGGSEHPPTDPGELSPGRRVVAVVSLILFVLLFMPTHMTFY
jgi:membrane-associated protease RseP (regulator of RpoE activity)